MRIECGGGRGAWWGGARVTAHRGRVGGGGGGFGCPSGPGPRGRSLPVQAPGVVEGCGGQTPPVGWEVASARRGPRGDEEAGHRGPPRGGARKAAGSVPIRTIWPRWQTGHSRSEIPVSAS